MAKKSFSIEVDENYVEPAGPFATDAAYMNHVVNMAVQSYGHHPDATSPLDGIRVAREMANRDRVLPEPAPEEPAAPEGGDA